jgi:hypothetical protein
VQLTIKKKRSLQGGRMLFLSKNPNSTSKPLLLPFYLLLYTLKSRKLFIPMAIRKVVLFIGTFFLFLVFSLSCEKQTTIVEDKPPVVTLNIEDIAVTEAWLNVKTEAVHDSDEVRVSRNDSIIFEIKPGPADTSLYDSGLHPAHAYAYRATVSRNGKILAESGYQNTITLDTTSHNFDWQKYIIESPFGSGVLYDLAIINENDIWAVGEIYADSTQPGLPYNAVHWDGTEWRIERIPFTGWCSAVEYPPIKAIFTFLENDIWFARGGSLVHYDGSNFYNDCDMNELLNGSINIIWGTNSNDMFIAGNSGTIIRYKGNNWEKLEIETDLNFKDVWGSWNESQGNMEVIAVASELFVSPDRLIYRLSPDQEVLSDEPIVWPLSTIWFISGRRYYVAGSGLYEKRTLKEPNWRNGPQDITTNYIFRIRGTGLNNIIAVGGYGEVLHYNGISWKSFYGETQINGNYYSVDVTDDIVVAVGYDSPNAVITVGRRIFGK